MKFRIPSGLVRAVRRVGVLPTGYRAQGVVAVALLLVAGGSGTKLVMHEAQALPADAAFRVYDTVVDKQQLSQRVNLMGFLYGLQQPTDPGQLDQFNRSVAKAVAVGEIVDAAAREKGIVIADKAASDQLDKLVQENSGKDRRAFVQDLGTHGLSEKDVLDEIKRQQVNARLFGQETGAVKPSTDADAQHYYDENRTQMVSPEQRVLSNIVVSSQEQAQQLARQAGSGADFGGLAKQFSIDGSTKDNGGALGAVRADQLDPAYAAAAFGAGKGAVFGPVRTRQGWNVGRVTDIQPAVPLSFDQLRDPIKTKLDNDAKLKVWNDFLGERIKAAAVEYAPEYQPGDPDAPPQPSTGH